MSTLLGQVSDTDIRLLRVFRAVVECGGFSAAELELDIGRSTISRHIKDLETRLGIVLCRRGRAGFALTDEGRRVYEALLKLLAALDAFRGDINGIHRRISGNLTLALFDKTASNPQSRISEAICRFEEIAPRVALEIYVRSLDDIEQGVLDGRYHIGIVPRHRTSSSMNYLPLFLEQMYLYCGSRHPLFEQPPETITPAAIRQCKYVGLGYHSPNMNIGHRLRLERSATVYDQESVATLVISGRYLGFLPDHYAAAFVDKGLMRPVAQEHFQYQCEFVAINATAIKPGRIVEALLYCLEQSHGSVREEFTKTGR